MALQPMKKLYLCFLWHMHQPYYKNPYTQTFEMPWVFLHAIKDYYEMPWHVSRYEKIKTTFNLVPSLIKQLKEYIQDPDSCYLIKTFKKAVESLTEEEKNYVLDISFNANLNTMIKPFERYYQLYLKKHSSTAKFTHQELADLQVLFLLSWTGNYLRENNEFVKNLSNKKAGFTHQDKVDLINQLTQFLKEIIPFYQKLQSDRKIEVSTTPYYHPIIPLLIDLTSAKESLPNIILPKVKVNFKDDAELQVKNAISFYQEIFESKPSGFWPSESSISNDTLKLFSQYNIKWTASDEDILFNSLGNKNLENLYKVYKYEGVYLFFRDKYLSDAIGFRYQNLDEKQAVKDFITRLKYIHEKVDFNPVVSVILDGENAWEFYKNNGKDFFDSLYTELSNQDWIEVITFSQVLKKDIVVENLNSVKAGSWIYGNFSTWIGHPEKNTAWEYLSQAKQVLESEKENENYKKAKEYLLIAQGSDWFWWYGDDHFNHYADRFDLLFRLNLQKVYEKLGKDIPTNLLKPIKKLYKQLILRQPTGYIKPVIDGYVSNYYEWLHSGEVDLKFDLSSMTFDTILEKLYYGYDEENLYLRLDGKVESITDKGYKLKVSILATCEMDFTFPLQSTLYENNGLKACSKKVIEIAIPLKLFSCRNFDLSFTVLENDKIIEKLPVYSVLNIDISQDFTYDWIV
ncbi:glycoside hydrolase [Sulfurihydrogenibium azorense Az-Fu1]|uniref:Glycoside hydrolase n=2 Tax=Sulfurihydrogenibium azorense TaxID=309806 RepID=C1DV51_SULAA|nr:glycoside hydrolase [Sulfurihydrogenibium azorense Az-Fu1]